MLGQALYQQGIALDDMQVLLLSNSQRQIPLLRQRLGQKIGTFNQPLVIWDYHVILQVEDNQHSWIMDFDSELAFPCLKHDYFNATLMPTTPALTDFEPICRYVPLTHYLQNFDSDRSHMLDTNGCAIAPFPDYPAIRYREDSGLRSNHDKGITLARYIDMDKEIDGTRLSRLIKDHNNEDK